MHIHVREPLSGPNSSSFCHLMHETVAHDLLGLLCKHTYGKCMGDLDKSSCVHDICACAGHMTTQCSACAGHMTTQRSACAGHMTTQCSACAGHMTTQCSACAGHMTTQCSACAGHMTTQCSSHHKVYYNSLLQSHSWLFQAFTRSFVCLIAGYFTRSFVSLLCHLPTILIIRCGSTVALLKTSLVLSLHSQLFFFHI